MNKEELKINEKSQNKTSTKTYSTLTSNLQPLTSDHKGITLIALVITIIVMLILVGVTVSVAINGGLFGTAKKATRETQIAAIEEMVRADIWAKEAENGSGDITAEQFKEVLEEYFDGVPGTAEELAEKYTDPDYSLKAKEEYGNGVDVKVSDLYDGEFMKETEYLDTTKSYIGCYADIDGNGSVDGIIYADLAVGGSGNWKFGDGTYNWTATPSEELKKYTVTGKNKAFRDVERDVISAAPNTTGQDRFYVMALEDLETSEYSYFYWWYPDVFPAFDLPGCECPFNDFGKGKENTSKILNKWNSLKSDDLIIGPILWDVIPDNEEFPDELWFVPSLSEMYAFADVLYQEILSGGFGLPVWADDSPDPALSDSYLTSSWLDSSHFYSFSFNIFR